MSNNSQTPIQSANRKVKIGQVIPVVILIVSVIGALYYSGFFDGTVLTYP